MGLICPFQKKAEFQPGRTLPSTDEEPQSYDPGPLGVRDSVLAVGSSPWVVMGSLSRVGGNTLN